MPPPGRNNFRVAEDKKSFFVSERKNKVKVDPKRRDGDIPAIVIPSLREQEMMARTPRGDKLTLPQIPSSARSSSRVSASMMSGTPKLASIHPPPSTDHPHHHNHHQHTIQGGGGGSGGMGSAFDAPTKRNKNSGSSAVSDKLVGGGAQTARQVDRYGHLEKLAESLTGSRSPYQNSSRGASSARVQSSNISQAGGPSVLQAATGRKVGPPPRLPKLTFEEGDHGIGSTRNTGSPSPMHEGAPLQPPIPQPPSALPSGRASTRSYNNNKLNISSTSRNQQTQHQGSGSGIPDVISQNYRYLYEYDGGSAAASVDADGLAREKTGQLLDDFEVHQSQLEREREDLLEESGLASLRKDQSKKVRGGSTNIATIDEEASVRVLKAMFQLDLTRNSQIVKRLKELDQTYLNKRVMIEVGHRKTLSREEFYGMLCRVLKDDFVNRRDSNTLFSVFDSDKSGVVDANEFFSGLLGLVSSGLDDIAFKFINTVLEGREKSTVNAFISRFELDVLIDAAQRHYEKDPEVVSVLGRLGQNFNFSHHQGRIPVIQLRQRILEDDDYCTIFENLPNPGADDAAAQVAANAGGTSGSGNNNNNNDSFAGGGGGSGGDKPTVTTDENEWLTSSNMVADQYMHPDWQRQASAVETDHPQWWTKEGTVYRSSEEHPYPEPVFFREK